MYYHINKDTLTIISGPHHESSDYIKKLTRCGTPEVLNLLDYDLVPEIKNPIDHYQSYGDPIVTATEVTIPLVEWFDQQIQEYEQQQLLERRANMSCTPRQANLALLQFGLLDAVEGWLSTQSRTVQIDWNKATEIKRNWPAINDAAIALGLTDEQLDELFTLAPTL